MIEVFLLVVLVLMWLHLACAGKSNSLACIDASRRFAAAQANDIRREFAASQERIDEAIDEAVEDASEDLNKALRNVADLTAERDALKARVFELEAKCQDRDRLAQNLDVQHRVLEGKIGECDRLKRELNDAHMIGQRMHSLLADFARQSHATLTSIQPQKKPAQS